MWEGDPVKDPQIRDNRASNLMGTVRTPQGSTTMCSGIHQGFDYKAPIGTPVLAVRQGIVMGVQPKDIGEHGKYIDLGVNDDDVMKKRLTR